MKSKGSASAPTDDYFPDKGCSVAPACLNCPLPRCRYDDPHWYLAWQRGQRLARVLAMRRPGVKASDLVVKLAEEFWVSERQAWRILAETRRQSDGAGGEAKSETDAII